MWSWEAFRSATPLQAALQRGLTAGGDLVKELRELGDYVIESAEDATVVCRALETLLSRAPVPRKGAGSALRGTVGLFQCLESAECPAFGVLREQGTRLLIRIVDAGIRDSEIYQEDELLFVLKILALYATVEGASAVIRAAKKPIAPNEYLWSVILGAFRQGHPEARRVFTELSDPLPCGFLAIALLDSANHLCVEGGELRHPFDSDAGTAQLERWLEDADPELFSYAASAAIALPFLNHRCQSRLFEIALVHPCADVQMEAAWGLARLGVEAGVEKLRAFCLQVDHAASAIEYLEEVGRPEVIPEMAQDPDFRARAEFARWLAHPNELGRSPDEVTVLDARELRWPPGFETKRFWLIQYRVRDPSGLAADEWGAGVVGSVTFCLFGYRLEERPVEDAYAIHCCWEMEQGGLYNEEEVEESGQEYRSLLGQWTGPPLEDARVLAIAELNPALAYPRQAVAVASASLNGVPGWVVLDGTESQWYPQTQMPEGTAPGLVLRIHVGRGLLGFPRPDTRVLVARPLPVRPPQEVITAYDRLIERARHSLSECRALFTRPGPLSEHFEAYVNALTTEAGTPRARHLAAAYEALLEVAREAGVPDEETFEISTAIGIHFADYIDALLELGRGDEIGPIIETCEPFWLHNWGFGHLGTAAFKAELWEQAERYFLLLKEGLADWPRAREMSLLAELWFKKGRCDDARQLLLDCLKKLSAQAQSASVTDRKTWDGWFQTHRATFLRLFPEEKKRLESHGIPEALRGAGGLQLGS